MDPLSYKFAFYTPYQYAGNKPIVAIDLDGTEDIWYMHNKNYNGSTTEVGVMYKDDITPGMRIALLSQFGLYEKDVPSTGSVTTVTDESGYTRVVSYLPALVVSPSPEFGEQWKKVGLAWEEAWQGKSNGNEMEGEKGLLEYAEGLDNVSKFVKLTPAAPVGEAMSIASDIIKSRDDFKKKDGITAGLNSFIRGATAGIGFYVGKYLDKFDFGKFGNKAIGFGAGEALDKTKEKLTEDEHKTNNCTEEECK